MEIGHSVVFFGWGLVSWMNVLRGIGITKLKVKTLSGVISYNFYEGKAVDMDSRR